MDPRCVVVLPGDGIGPEVTEHALAVLERVSAITGAELVIESRLIGGVAIEAEGTPLSEETVAICQRADAVLLGAVGGPPWDHLTGEMRCESGLLRLRRELGVFANLRPVRVHPALAQRSTLKPEVIEGVDMLVVRELTGGVYFGQPRGREGSGPSETARDSMVYTRAEIERVARVAFELARGRRRKLTSVDKQNVLVSSRLWRDVVSELAAEYPDVELEHQLVDACAMRLIRAPRDFDVVVTENLFGDILTDEAAMLTGSLGMLPSASLGEPNTTGLYEPIHGSAPDIAGQGTANPLGSILCVAMMLRSSLDMAGAAEAVEGAVDDVVEAGILTLDLGGSASTADVAAAVMSALVERLQPVAAGA
ncbi:MAG: 3-isopropylmalate dehydrogenase [Candidatus Dormibacteria bacterium]